MKDCTKCFHKVVCKTADSCDGHVPSCRYFFDATAISQTLEKPITRGDKLRAMTDEQLAAALYENADCVWCVNADECGEMIDAGRNIEEHKCIACVLNWLRQLAEEEQK